MAFGRANRDLAGPAPAPAPAFLLGFNNEDISEEVNWVAGQMLRAAMSLAVRHGETHEKQTR